MAEAKEDSPTREGEMGSDAEDEGDDDDDNDNNETRVMAHMPVRLEALEEDDVDAPGVDGAPFDSTAATANEKRNDSSGASQHLDLGWIGAERYLATRPWQPRSLMPLDLGVARTENLRS